jgi:hypothetical protein
VHEQCGGGSHSFSLLEKLSISSKIRPIILERISHFGGKYYAVHVRNTDLKTDYKEFFSEISPQLKNKPLLVCSDDLNVIQYARAFFSSSDILVSSEIPDTKGKAIHGDYSENSKKNSIDAIVDLIALGKSEKLFFSRVNAGHTSGFSALAAHLSRNKYVIKSLLGTPGVDLTVTGWRLKQYRRRLRVYLRGLRFEYGSRETNSAKT